MSYVKRGRSPTTSHSVQDDDNREVVGGLHGQFSQTIDSWEYDLTYQIQPDRMRVEVIMEFTEALLEYDSSIGDIDKIRKELTASRLREEMENRGLSLRNLAELTGRHYTYWAHIRSGRKVFTKAVVRDLIKAFRLVR